MKNRKQTALVMLHMIGRAERAITFSAYMILITVLFGDVLSRELTGAGLSWARDLGVLANLLLTLVGIGIASAEGAHLRPRFADRWLPADWNPILEGLKEAFMAVFCLGFAIVAIVAVIETFRLDDRLTVLHWPVWPLQAVIPLVFMIAALRHGMMAIYPSLRPGASGSAATGVGNSQVPS